MADSRNPKELQEKLQEVLSDEGFARELLAMERPEDVQIALEKKDIELSLDEVRQIGETIQNIQSGEISQEQLESMADGELSEEELGEVAGGTIIGTIAAIILCVGGFGGLIGGGIYAGVRNDGW